MTHAFVVAGVQRPGAVTNKAAERLPTPCAAPASPKNASSKPPEVLRFRFRAGAAQCATLIAPYGLASDFIVDRTCLMKS